MAKVVLAFRNFANAIKKNTALDDFIREWAMILLKQV
jgi:hypothetical protein